MRPRSDIRFRSVNALQVSWALRQLNLDAHRVQPSLQRQLDRITRLVLEQRTDHRLLLTDLLQIDRGYDVANLHARRFRWASLDDPLNVNPLFHRERPLGNDRVVKG